MMSARRLTRFGAEIVAALVLAPVLIWRAVGIPYSTGERVGFVSAVSELDEHGLYEGTLTMALTPGEPGAAWTFSVRDRNVFDELAALKGQRVAVHYEQTKGGRSIPAPGTEYTAIAVHTIN